MTRERLAVEAYVDGVLHGDRAVLARAITLIESERADDAALAAEVLDAVLPHAGGARRLGVTGAPGVGKSTFIDALGMHLVRERDESVAVLSVDPSSPFSGGSILGDKTRMARLALEGRAYIRPSPARGVLGGVARRTRETILLCEAAGFDTVIVETVGVGQSETAVRSMTDFFLLLVPPGGGDQLQGIKRGIIEMADAIAINKADGDLAARAGQTCADYAAALHVFPPSADGWAAPVRTCSALTGAGVAELWQIVLDHRAQLEANGHFGRRRSAQARAWLHELIGAGLDAAFRAHPVVAASLPVLETAVAQGRTTPFAAARELLERFRNGSGRPETWRP
jgi:LAO/AO transport system kinase